MDKLAKVAGDGFGHTLGHTEIELNTAAMVRLAEALEQAAPRARPASSGHSSNAGIRARSFVRVMLLDGPRPWVEIVAQGKKFNHHERTMRRRRDEVAECFYNDGVWLWRLKEGMGNG